MRYLINVNGYQSGPAMLSEARANDLARTIKDIDPSSKVYLIDREGSATGRAIKIEIK